MEVGDHGSHNSTMVTKVTEKRRAEGPISIEKGRRPLYPSEGPKALISKRRAEGPISIEKGRRPYINREGPKALISKRRAEGPYIIISTTTQTNHTKAATMVVIIVICNIEDAEGLYIHKKGKIKKPQKGLIYLIIINTPKSQPTPPDIFEQPNLTMSPLSNCM